MWVRIIALLGLVILSLHANRCAADCGYAQRHGEAIHRKQAAQRQQHCFHLFCFARDRGSSNTRSTTRERPRAEQVFCVWFFPYHLVPRVVVDMLHAMLSLSRSRRIAIHQERAAMSKIQATPHTCTFSNKVSPLRTPSSQTLAVAFGCGTASPAWQFQQAVRRAQHGPRSVCHQGGPAHAGMPVPPPL